MKLSSPIILIKKSVEIFFEKKNMINFVKLYLPLVPFSLFSIWQNINIKNMEQFKDLRLVSLVLLINIAYLIIYLWIYVAGVIAIGKVVRSQSIELRKIYKMAWGMFWKFSLLSLALLLIYMSGLILLLIPVLIFGIWYSFSKFLFIHKGLSIRESIIQSKNLARNKFWAIFGRYLVFGLATSFLGITLSLIPFGIGGIVTTVFGALFVLPYYLLYLEVSESV